jgi:hypothetical protein
MRTSLIGHGPNGDEEAQVDQTYDALRVSLRPLEFQTPNQGVLGGHYSIGAQTQLIAAGIASLAQIFQVRWADPTKLFILKKLTVQCSTATGFAATTLGAPLELIIGHGSTANGSGGSALAPTSISNRLRQSMASTGFVTSGEIRVATTAALTAATGQTLEPAPVASCAGADNRTLVSTPVMNLFEQRDFGAHPLVLNSGDTLAVRTNSPAATGTWYAFFSMEWVEAVNY